MPSLLTLIGFFPWLVGSPLRCGQSFILDVGMAQRLLIMRIHIHITMCVCIYIYGKCLGFARNRNHDRQRIIRIIRIIIIIVIIIIIKPLLKIFKECRSLTGVGELNPYWRSSMNVEVWELNPYWRSSMNVEFLKGVGELNPYRRSSMNVEVWRRWGN